MLNFVILVFISSYVCVCVCDAFASRGEKKQPNFAIGEVFSLRQRAHVFWSEWWWEWQVRKRKHTKYNENCIINNIWHVTYKFLVSHLNDLFGYIFVRSNICIVNYYFMIKSVSAKPAVVCTCIQYRQSISVSRARQIIIIDVCNWFYFRTTFLDALTIHSFRLSLFLALSLAANTHFHAFVRGKTSQRKRRSVKTLWVNNRFHRFTI